QFTLINALAYADVEAPQMSRATTFAAVAQQLSLSAGVAFAALALEGAQAARSGAALLPADFSAAFVAVAALSAASALVFRQLRADAGAEVSSHVLATAPAQPEGRGTRG